VLIEHDKIFLVRNPCITRHDQDGAVLNGFYPSLADMDIQD
jgi:hypothetical protein